MPATEPADCLGMTEAVTYVIELAVGLGCLVAGAASLRQARLRLLGVLLLMAGAASAAHALARLLV